MAASALERQNKRVETLKKKGIERTSVLIHENCRPAFDNLKPYLIDPDSANFLSEIAGLKTDHGRQYPNYKINQLSPFRYPGGKSWLVPEINNLLAKSETRITKFIEPFAGGANVGLNAAMNSLADSIIMSEIDPDVAAVWSVLINAPLLDIQWLCKRISTFEVSIDNVKDVLASKPRLDKTIAFKTIIKNRMQRGGILADGAGLINQGENGRGLLSRWYPETLVKRIMAIQEIRKKIKFEKIDGFELIRQHGNDPLAYFFVDPPYTAGGKNAGSRLYRHSIIDHERLFCELSSVKGQVLMTYDDTSEVRRLAKTYNFKVKQISMKNTHHRIVREILITNKR